MPIKTLQEIVRERMHECAELVAAEFFPAVRPVYRTKRGVPEHSGTCTLLEIRGDKYLITAAHVIDDYEHWPPLLVGGVGFESVQQIHCSDGSLRATEKPQGDRNKDHYDFAVWKIPEDVAAGLGNVTYITETQVVSDPNVPVGRNYLAMGYPVSRNKHGVNVARKTIVPTTWKYSSTVKEDPTFAKALGVSGTTHCFLKYNREHSRNDRGEEVTAISARGLSGGPLMDLGYLGAPENLDAAKKCEARLAGILIECHDDHEAIVALRIGVVLRAAGILTETSGHSR
jgi:hypothetical protein